MPPIEKLNVASTDHGITIARWDDDGGAPRHSPSDVDARATSAARKQINPTRTGGEIDEIPPSA
jgi:hypothetical protein